MLKDYLNQVQIEVAANWGMSPVCSHFCINMFVGVLQHNRSLVDLAIKAKVIALKKDSVTKYKIKGK
jgi:hypothetical protein